MTEANPVPSSSSIVLQMPKAHAELTWVEQAHGVESVMTTIALIIGAVWALFGDWRKSKTEREAERNLRDREREQREDLLNEQRRKREWDQTQVAREINEKFLADAGAQQALGLVDCDGDDCTLSDTSDKESVKKYKYDLNAREDVYALRIDPNVSAEKDVFLRDCFDAWFYWMAVMEQYLRNGLIRQQDIAFPSDYYLRNLRGDSALNEACIKYVTHYQLSPNVFAFMKRFADADPAVAP